MNSRLKLTINTQIAKSGNTIIDSFISCAFNFHFDLASQDRVTVITGAINQYDALFKESEKIISSYE